MPADQQVVIVPSDGMAPCERRRPARRSAHRTSWSLPVALIVGLAVTGSGCADSKPADSDADTATATAAPWTAELAEELRAMGTVDQEVREGVGPETLTDSAFMGRMIRADSANSRRLRDLIAKHGWPRSAEVGPDAAEAAFLIVQHTPFEDWQRDMLSTVEEAVRAGQLDAQSYALLYDRVQTKLGRPRSMGRSSVRPRRARFASTRSRTRKLWTPCARNSACRPSRSTCRSSRKHTGWRWSGDPSFQARSPGLGERPRQPQPLSRPCPRPDAKPSPGSPPSPPRPPCPAPSGRSGQPRSTSPDPLDGTIADYLAGLRRGDWTVAEVTARRARALPDHRHDAARDRRPVGDRARRGAGGRRAPARRGDPRAPRRRPRVREGDIRHGPHPDDGLERRVGAALPRRRAARLHRDPAPARGGRDRARQDGGRRLRLSRRGDQQPHRPGRQSVRPERHADAGRLERGIGGGRGDRDGVRGARHRRRRVQPHPGRLHRRRRHEADLRARAAGRRHPDLALPRHPRTARPARRRRGPAARRRRGARSVGPARAHRARSTPRRSSRCATTRSTACGWDSSRRTCRATR